MDKTMMLHHPLSILGLFLPLYENTQGNFVMFAIFLTEVSNPSMHLRHILRISGRKHTKLFELAELCFILLYMYARFFAIGPAVYSTLSCKGNHLLIKMACMGLFVQSLFFITQMYRSLGRRYKEVALRKRNGIKLNWLKPLDKL